MGAQRVLKRLYVDDSTTDIADTACEGRADLTTSGERLSLLRREAANRLALDLLDACAELAEDNPGALPAGAVVEVIGTKVATMEFDSGVPGSGQGAGGMARTENDHRDGGEQPRPTSP